MGSFKGQLDALGSVILIGAKRIPRCSSTTSNIAVRVLGDKQ